MASARRPATERPGRVPNGHGLPGYARRVPQAPGQWPSFGSFPMYLPDLVALGGGEPEMGTIVTQNVTQDAGKANDYRLLYISAGQRDRRADLIISTTSVAPCSPATHWTATIRISQEARVRCSFCRGSEHRADWSVNPILPDSGGGMETTAMTEIPDIYLELLLVDAVRARGTWPPSESPFQLNGGHRPDGGLRRWIHPLGPALVELATSRCCGRTANVSSAEDNAMPTVKELEFGQDRQNGDHQPDAQP
jgi:hypothetical protein